MLSLPIGERRLAGIAVEDVGRTALGISPGPEVHRPHGQQLPARVHGVGAALFAMRHGLVE